MHILSFTSLYPSSLRPTFGIFVENRLSHLHASGAVKGGVIAPCAYFPVGSNSQKPHPTSDRRGLKIWHPTFLSPPKTGMYTAPYALYHSGKKAIEAYIKQHGRPDLLDIHYIYPDGVAGAWLADHFGIPCVMTARGTDISLLPQYAFPKRLILKALDKASSVITVCEALRQAIITDLGISGDKIVTLRNGVDLKRFSAPESVSFREALRTEWNFTGHTLLSVGHLVERKGHHLIIEALAHLPETVSLAIAGEGEEKASLTALIQRLNLGHRVRLLGNLSPERLATAYGASDVLVLASSREGWANVLLEAMACGTPVCATAIWGTPEIVTQPCAGRLIPERTPLSIAETVKDLLRNLPNRKETRTYAEAFSWDATTQGQLDLFQRILGKSA